jgi:hypothetical protein
MQLGETIATYDVALALRGESGKFEVTSPAGETFHVTCKPNHSIASFEWSGSKADAQPFMIRKVAEPVSPQQGTTTEGESLARTNQTPFLLETQGNEAKQSSNGDRIISLAKIAEDNSGVVEPANLDLLFLERDPKTEQPSARVLVNRGMNKIEGAITTTCATFNEFDSEIRRLHAQLDEIRARARKMFYKSQIAASA